MFVGHFAVAMGLKRVAPVVSLGTLFLAAQFIDLLWPTLLLLGWERVEVTPGITAFTPLDFVSYPISHSLLAVVVWAVGFTGVYWLLRRSLTAAVVCGAAVLSHWILDLVVHRPDLPLLPGADLHVGLGLWNSIPGTLAVELGLYAVGVALYVRTTSASDRVGSIGLWTLVGFLLLVHLGNVLGPPPDSVTAIAWVGHAQWILVVWAYWVDAHRRAPMADGRTREAAQHG